MFPLLDHIKQTLLNNPQLCQQAQNHFESLIPSEAYEILYYQPDPERPEKSNDCVLPRCFPITFLPATFPREQFEQVRAVQDELNHMIHRLSMDDAFIRQVLDKVLAEDDFTRRLYAIYEKNKFPTNKYAFGIYRTDYILDQSNECKQVEINTISAGLSGITTPAGRLHDELVRYVLTNGRESQGTNDMMNEWMKSRIPNFPTQQIGEAFNWLINQYRTQFNRTQESTATVLVVIEEKFANKQDVIKIEKQITEQAKSFAYTVEFLELTFRELETTLSCNDQKELIYQKDATSPARSIPIVYYRTGYVPVDYADDRAWATRELIESSQATKCPSIAHQLVGQKTFQRALASDKSVLARYINGPFLDTVWKTFTKFYAINEQTLAMVREKGEQHFVLKPNLEGGGNNYFGTTILAKMEEIIREHQQDGYLLMDYIHQPPYGGQLYKSSGPAGPGIQVSEWSLLDQLRTPQMLNNELGIYGVIVAENPRPDRKPATPVINRTPGYLLRTKLSSSNEIGLMSGNGYIDSICFV